MFVQRLSEEGSQADGSRKDSPRRARQRTSRECGRAVQAWGLRGGRCRQRDEKELVKNFKLERIKKKKVVAIECGFRTKSGRKYSRDERSGQLGHSYGDPVTERLAGDLSSTGLCDLG